MEYCKIITSIETVDVPVIGGGPAGICEAVSAAHCGKYPRKIDATCQKHHPMGGVFFGYSFFIHRSEQCHS